MFCLETQTPEFFNDLCDEIRLFFDVKRIEQTVNGDCVKVLRHFFSVEGNSWISGAEYLENGEVLAALSREAAMPQTDDTLVIKKLKKRLCKQTIYELLKQHTGTELPWGSLTGIRPVKLARELADEKGDAAREEFAQTYDVSPLKVKLAFDIARNQRAVLASITENAIDLYIGIPFCVSRCKYCSFISRDMQQSQGLKKEYLDCLQYEMEQMKEVVQGYHVRCIYIGGGTPTALDEEELERLLNSVAEYFEKPVEYTVEAGRPDTVTRKKLAVIKRAGATRISINAQTTKQQTLELIGRKHSVKDFFAAFDMARQAGFDNINTDIILGLPGETVEDTLRTLEQVSALQPENITVHTLAIKNASEFALEQHGHFCGRQVMEGMVDGAQEYLYQQGYQPYYLYRQKYMNGNLENVGFTKPDFACVYNIDIMEEQVSNLAFGAGAISKRLFGGESRIERAANVKDVKHYVERTAEMVERKKKLFGGSVGK